MINVTGKLKWAFIDLQLMLPMLPRDGAYDGSKTDTRTRRMDNEEADLSR